MFSLKCYVRETKLPYLMFGPFYAKVSIFDYKKICCIFTQFIKIYRMGQRIGVNKIVPCVEKMCFF